MIVEADKGAVREIIRGWRRQGLSVGLVPTMGYFHAGHLALMKKAGELCDRVVVSLFVNPTQFAPGEDLDTYPRKFSEDRRKAADTGVDLLFCPAAADMYGPGHQTEVTVSGLARGLCGRDRPGHFTGVATVVAKLFNLIEPDCAVFGEKDYQQLTIIRRMVADLDFPVSIIGHPIVREADGLAMSSRNSYLSEKERLAAVVLSRALFAIRDEVHRSAGPHDSADALGRARQIIEACRSCVVDYLAIIDAETLQPCPTISAACRAVGAVRINERIRLIDNVALNG